MRKISLRQAINEALAEEMERDPKVFMMGEDIATGGAYAGVTVGLPEKVGAGRIINTPISESCFTGAAVGAALRGYRPIIEYMLGDFVLVAADQVINQAAKARYMAGGRVCVPLTILCPTGGYLSQASQHSQSLEVIYIHTPGIKVVYPSGPYSAKGLLKSSIRDDNPVAFLEPKVLWDAVEEVPEEEYTIPLGKANIVLKSVAKTGRLLLIQEDHKVCSLSEHIAFEIYANLDLKSKIEIISSKFAPVPFSPELEKDLLPQVDDIINGIKKILGNLQ